MNQFNLPSDVELIDHQLKAILNQYRVMNSSIRRRLKALGFQITKGRGHYKIYYMHEQSRYVTISASASEYRTGRNLAKNIFRYLIVPYFQKKQSDKKE